MHLTYQEKLCAFNMSSPEHKENFKVAASLNLFSFNLLGAKTCLQDCCKVFLTICVLRFFPCL